jgi:Cd2+/Zn2+-exporting ATPase
MGRGAGAGVIFRGGEVMDAFCRMDAIALDKTGTLTESALRFEGAEIYSTLEEKEFLALSYAVLSHSAHAAARSFCLTQAPSEQSPSVSEVENLSGRGIRCLWDGRVAVFGNAAFLRENGVDVCDRDTTVIHGALGGVLLGTLSFSAPLKEGSAEAITELRTLGVERIAVLSGDSEGAVRESCLQADIQEYYPSLTPSEKVETLCRIQSEEEKRGRGRAVAFCGDGLNDSAVVAGAQIGIAMGKGGSALTVEEADAVIMDDDLRKIPVAIRIARRTARIATQNIALSLGIKLAVLVIGVAVLAFTGQRIPMEIAMVADVGAAILTVSNALRASK